MSHARFAQRVLIAIAMVAVALLLWRVSRYLLLGFGGIVFAVVIRAAGAGIARRLPVPTPLASALFVLAAVAAATLAIAVLGDEAARQFNALRQALPETVERLQAQLGASEMGRAVLSTLDDSITGALGMSWVFGTATVMLDVLTDLAIVLFIAIYLGISPRPYVRATLALVPPAHRARTQAALHDCGGELRAWLLGQVVAMTFVGVLSGIGLWLVGVPHAFALGVLVGLLDFVPLLGPLVAAVPGVVLAYLDSPVTALYAIAVYVGVQQVEGMAIQPLAQRWAVELPPVIGLLAIVVAGAVFGLPGVLFAVPLVVVLRVLVHRFWLDRYAPVQAA